MEDREEVLSDNEVESDKTIVAAVDELEKIDVVDDKKEETAPTTKVETKKENKNNNNKTPMIIVIVVATAIIGVLTILYITEMLDNKENKELLSGEISEEKDILADSKKNVLNTYGLKLEKANLDNYIKYNKFLSIDELMSKDSNTYKISCKTKEAYDDGTIYLNECTANGIDIDASYGTKKTNVVKESGSATIENNSIVVYEYTTTLGKSYSLIQPAGNNYVKKTITTNQLENDDYAKPRIIGNKYIYYVEKDYKPQLKDIATDKKIAEQENYEYVLLFKEYDSFYDENYIALFKDKKLHIYDIRNNKFVTNTAYEDLDLFILGCGTTGPSYALSTLTGHYITAQVNGKKGVIDFTNGKEIVPLKYTSMLKQDKMLIVGDGNRSYLYDFKGKEYLKNEDITNIYASVNNSYALVNQKGKIKLVLINGTELYNFGELNIKGLHISSSDIDKVSFEVTTSEKFDKCIDLEYDFATKKGSSKEGMCAGISKPILYLYPEKQEKVTVTFDNPEVLETTYPKYNGKWEVTANVDGSLYDKDGQYYYALYWDEQKIHPVDFKEGFYVTKNNAIKFLEDKLDYIGLSPKEKNEFIMYWLPILEKNKKSLVYFELTEERNSYSKINITPKPDSMLRLVIHIKKVNKKTNIKEQKLTKFDRKGFTAVEWGGTTY